MCVFICKNVSVSKDKIQCIRERDYDTGVLGSEKLGLDDVPIAWDARKWELG